MNFTTRNPVSASTGVYITRPSDAELYRVLASGCHTNARGPRMAGKTSTLYTVAERLRADGHRTVYGSLHTHASASSAARMWTLFERALFDEMDLASPQRSEDLTLSRQVHMTWAALEHAAPPQGRLYVLVDEVDILRRYASGDVTELLIALRHEAQTRIGSSVVWLLMSVSPIALMVDSELTGGSTANFAVDVMINPFTNDQYTWEQIARQGFPDQHIDSLYPVLQKLLALSGGHAYLTAAMCDRLQRDSRPLADAFTSIQTAVMQGTDDFVGPYVEQLTAQLAADRSRTVMQVIAYRRVWSGEQVSDAENNFAFTMLCAIGLLRREGGFYKVANLIFQGRLDDRWVQSVYEYHQATVGGRGRSLSFEPTFSGRRRVALLTMGGTLGMIKDPKGDAVFDGADMDLLKFTEGTLSKLADVEFVPFYTFDGINVTPAEWHSLSEWIHARRDQYDGFVVGHGTDTLAWTASATAFILGRSVAKPIIFTGAQGTISDIQSDAADNLIRSTFLAVHPQAPREVTVQFGSKVFRAVRAEKADDRLFDGFRSPGWSELAQVTEQILFSPFAQEGRGRPEADLGYQPHLASNIFAIPILPGIRTEYYEGVLDRWANGNKPDGVCIHTPGAGNIPNRTGHNFREIIRRLVTDLDIPVVITSQVPINPYTQPQYEMARVVTDYGAILAGNMTFAAATAKMIWVVGCVNQAGTFAGKARMDEIARRMRHNYQGEQSESPPPTTSSR